MSLLKYNGVTFPYTTITRFDQQAVYDDLSQTDWCYTKIDLQAQAVLNANYLSFIAPDLIGKTDDAVDIMNLIRSRLLQPRKALSLKVNGQELIPRAAPDGSGTCDARNGPQPQSCSITQLTATTFLCTYSITGHYWENNNPDSTPPIQNRAGAATLYNRWTEMVDIDRLCATTRTRDGKFVIRTDNKEGLTVDQLRPSMAFLGLPQGFERINSRYVVDPSGLGVAYTITDKETFKRPPRPAYEADGEYTETLSKQGAQRWGMVRVYLKGSVITPQDTLVETAVAIATTKLMINGAATPVFNPGGGFRFGLLESASIMAKMYENHCEVQMRCLMKPLSKADMKKRANGMVGTRNFKNFVFTPLSDGVNYTPSHLLYGTANVLLRAAAYYDPSLGGSLNAVTGQMDRGKEVGTAGKSPE